MQTLRTETTKQDTIYNLPSLDISLLTDVQLNELPEAAGVVVVHGFGVAEGLHDGTAEEVRRQRGFVRAELKTGRLSQPAKQTKGTEVHSQRT